MRYYYAASLAAALAPLSDALHLVRRDVPAVLHLETQRRTDIDFIAHDRLRRGLGKRDGKTLQADLDNLQTLYFANATLGTPEQSFRFHIDTGSSDLWVNAANSSFCEDSNNGCSDSGTYSPDDSSSYEFVNDDFNISYVDGSGATGDYAKETFKFGGATVDGLQFGIGYTSSSPEGILGIGYTTNEVQVQRVQGGQPYPNLPQALVDNGMINSNAYSLWLNDLDASMGSILFGGVDTRKYNGELQTLPVIAESNGKYAEFIIALTGMGQNGQNGSIFSDQTVPVLLDSGSTLMYLPDEVADALFTSMNAQYNSRAGVASIDCSAADSTDTLDFTFSGPTISVPMNELVIVASVSRRGVESCILGIAPSGGSTAVLGDTFLRSAYVVYDLQGNTISLAQTAFNSTESNVLEINSSGDIPNATGVPGAIATADVTGGGARNGGAGSTNSQGAGPRATAMPWAGAAAVGVGLLAVL
ncbi:acid protease [Pseudovirgaria hyperparasitica]|uniref:Probable aspartic-type endopeptidase OPSB n=1 Tax=Pseudovirgaria hyperparasitica TaxID=470096 RepID=A0A6A6W148_9PEZI|nr:acid protease [Pseudovirgaria hyperparasitica]KAF2755704.1 acid protease [Pseudovirgaria hyperparasitica]